MGVWKKFGIENNFSSTPPSNLNYDWSLSVVIVIAIVKNTKVWDPYNYDYDALTTTKSVIIDLQRVFHFAYDYDYDASVN